MSGSIISKTALYPEQTLEDIGQLLDQMTNHLIKLKQPEQSMKSNSMFPAMSLDGFDFQEENLDVYQKYP